MVGRERSRQRPPAGAATAGHAGRDARGRGGTQSLNYNADGTINWIHYPDGINAASTLTFEYVGGLVSAIRLRDGGSGGTVLNSVTFGYDGAGRVSSIAQS